ncbi:MAG: cation:proton antiporter [Rhizobiales bacterium]|nr:cation:proton antiporter [Hyphomicrobiales bacterium]
MDGTVDPSSYKEILIILVAAGVIIPVFRKIGISSVLGFLIVGILIGPSVLGQFAADYRWLNYFTLSHRDEVHALAELGVVFLLFMIGLELSFERLMTLRRYVFGLGGLQVVISSVAIGGIAYALGLAPAESAIIGAALSLSSTAIIIQLLSDEKRLGSSTGRKAFSILLFQDLAVVPILVMIGIFSAQENGAVATGVIKALFQAGAAIAVILLVGRYLMRPLLRLVAQAQSSDLFMAATLLIAVGTGILASLAGMSMALGAFIAGLLLAETEFRREIEAIIEPFKGLMLGAFFMLVGMGIDLGEVVDNPLLVVGLALGLIAIKAVTILAAGAILGIMPSAMLETAILLGPGGEFAFAILATAQGSGLLSPVGTETALIVVSISMLAIPLFARIGQRMSKKLVIKGVLPAAALEPPPGNAEGRVIIVGFGRVGKLVAAMLQENQIPFIAIEVDADIVTAERKRGTPIFFGDAARPEFLKRCGIAEAKAVAITVNAPSKADAILQSARRARADLKIIARARDEKHAMHLYQLGVTEAVPETIEAALQLGEAVLVESGVAMGLAIASVHERRDGFRKLLGRPNRREELRKQLRSRRARSVKATE